MTSWKTYRLGELVKVKGGKRLPKGISLQIAPNTHPYIRIRDMGKSRVLELDATYEYVDDVTQKSIARYVVDEGDILLSIVGTIGLVGIVGKSLHQANQTENCVKLVNLNGIDPLFLYYFLLSPKGQEEIKRGTVGAVQAKLPIKNIENIEISLPPLEEQRRIAGILGAIDDKIENNRRINANLESQAQALYKQWFVDNRSDDWEEKPLAEIAEFIGGYSYKGNELVDTSTMAMATIKNFERKGGFRVEGFKDIVASSKLKVEQHATIFDILVAHTDLTQNADVIGNAEILLTCGGYSDIIFSMDLVKVLPKVNFPYKFLLAAMLKNPYFKAHCLGYVNGTTVLHMSKKALPEYVFACPSNEEAEKMDNAFKAYYQKMAEILQENETLATLRETLLPKLMNGEIKL